LVFIFKESVLNSRVVKKEPVVDEPAKKIIVSLEDILEEYEDKINDGGYLYAGYYRLSDIEDTKKRNAINSYAHDWRESDDRHKSGPDGELLVLYDITVFGSADDGFYLTEDEIFIKEAFQDVECIKLKNIRRISASDGEFSVNGNEITYISSLRRPMKIIVECIKTYIAQFK